MPMIFDRKRASMLFGTGDVALCSCEVIDGDRRYVMFRLCESGAIGAPDKVGRVFPVKRGDTQVEDTITMEFANRESLDSVIRTLEDYGRDRFGPPDDPDLAGPRDLPQPPPGQASPL